MREKNRRERKNQSMVDWERSGKEKTIGGESGWE